MIFEITIDQKEEWKGYVRRCANYDFYHTWDYHSLDTSGEPMLFVYQEGDDFIAFPLLKRPIPNSNLFDLTSVYGYAGPFSNKKFDDLDETFLENFRYSFSDHLKSRKYISVFTRLHPFLYQDKLMKRFGGVCIQGRTVAIDLTVPLEKQREKYNKNVKYYIRKTKRKGYQIKEARGLNEMLVFREIYLENMKRIKAESSYLFSFQYFSDLLKAGDFDCKLMLVYDGETAISGAIITCTNGIVQVHLIATKTDYLVDSPAKLLVDEISVMARNAGMKYCHLGGGLGFKEDSLFAWKASFSDLFLSYNSWGYVANESAYNTLVAQNGISNRSSDFFPLYRSKQTSD